MGWNDQAVALCKIVVHAGHVKLEPTRFDVGGLYMLMIVEFAFGAAFKSESDDH